MKKPTIEQRSNDLVDKYGSVVASLPSVVACRDWMKAEVAKLCHAIQLEENQIWDVAIKVLTAQVADAKIQMSEAQGYIEQQDLKIAKLEAQIELYHIGGLK